MSSLQLHNQLDMDSLTESKIIDFKSVLKFRSPTVGGHLHCLADKLLKTHAYLKNIIKPTEEL